MSDSWRKLSAALTLVMFVFTNGALSAHAGTRLSQRSCSCTQTAFDSDEFVADCDSVCAHCTPDAGSGAAEMTESNPLESLPSDEGATPCDHDTCPCPEGCVYCSVAKVLGYTPPFAHLTLSFQVEQCVAETAPVYLPPIASRLIRPPRV